MEPVAVVEVLDARRVVRQRVRLTAFPAVIGRGYGSDVIVDDPFVCPRHLRIFADDAGELVAEDVASVNGIFRGRERVTQVPLARGATLRIGRTTIRIFPADHPIAPTVADLAPASSLVGMLESRGVMLGVCAAAYILFAVGHYLASYEPDSGYAAAVTPIFIFGLLALWAGAWSLAGRTITHRFSFLRHLTIAAAVAAIAVVGFELADWLEFYSPGNGLAIVLTLGALGGLTVVSLYAHMSIASAAASAERWKRAAWAGFAFVAVTGLFAYAADDEFSYMLEDPGHHKPLSARFVRSTSAAVFAEEANVLKLTVDSLAARAGRGEGPGLLR